MSSLLVGDKDKILYSPSLRVYAIEVAKLISEPESVSQCLTLFLKSMGNAVKGFDDIIPEGLQLDKIISLTDEQVQLLHQIDEKFPLKKKVNLYEWLFNSNLLPDEFIKNLREKDWSKDELSPLSNTQLLSMALLCDKDSKSFKTIKLIILSLNIWNCGLHGGMYTNDDHFMFNALPDTFEWKRDELDTIEHNLEDNLAEIKSPFRVLFHDMYWRILPVVEDMEIFMKKYFMDTGHEKIRNQIINLLIQLRDWRELEEGLHHPNDENVVWALQKLFGFTRNNSFGKYERYFNDVLELAFYKEGYVLTNALFYLYYVLSNKTENVMGYEEYQKKLTWLLQKFTNHDLREFDVNVVDSTFYLSRIAQILQSNGVKDPSIDYWVGRSDRFNFSNIEYMLSKKK